MEVQRTAFSVFGPPIFSALRSASRAPIPPAASAATLEHSRSSVCSIHRAGQSCLEKAADALKGSRGLSSLRNQPTKPSGSRCEASWPKFWASSFPESGRWSSAPSECRVAALGPVLSYAARKAGIHRKTLEYCMKCSEACYRPNVKMIATPVAIALYPAGAIPLAPLAPSSIIM